MKVPSVGQLSIYLIAWLCAFHLFPCSSGKFYTFSKYDLVLCTSNYFLYIFQFWCYISSEDSQSPEGVTSTESNQSSKRIKGILSKKNAATNRDRIKEENRTECERLLLCLLI